MIKYKIKHRSCSAVDEVKKLGGNLNENDFDSFQKIFAMAELVYMSSGNFDNQLQLRSTVLEVASSIPI